MEKQVVIIGGGVVGLSAALFLAQHGVETMLVERHAGTSIHPRARGVNGRTMELFRELGLEAQVRAAGEAIAPSFGFITGPTLVAALDAAGYPGLVGRWLRRRAGAGKHGSAKSPTSGARVTQDLLEPVLLAAARERGVETRFSTHAELTDDSRCTLIDRVTGARCVVQPRFIIAADGARGGTRDRLGIRASGAGVLSRQLNIYFRADLGDLVKGREFSMCTVENGGLRGMFASVNNRDLWVLHVVHDGDGAATPERCAAWVRQAVGIADLRVEIKGALPWQSIVRVADAYRSGNVFLAGDAAHLMPPWGGFGANTGVHDVHNLAWKLAHVLDGRASDALLDTYFTERHPVARAVSRLAGSLNDERGLMREHRLGVLWQMRKVFPYLLLGYGYDSPAILADPVLPPSGPGTRALDGRPGTRVPHVWLDASTSTLDRCGREFVLFLGADATMVEGPFRTQRLADLRAFGLPRSGAALVRPDGFVAWRTRQDPPGARVAVAQILRPDRSLRPKPDTPAAGTAAVVGYGGITGRLP